VNNVEVRSVTV